MRWYPAVTNSGEAVQVFNCDVSIKAALVDREAAVLSFPPLSPMVSLCLSLRSHCIALSIECLCWRYFLLLLWCWLHPYCISATPRSAHSPSYLPPFNECPSHSRCQNLIVWHHLHLSFKNLYVCAPSSPSCQRNSTSTFPVTNQFMRSNVHSLLHHYYKVPSFPNWPFFQIPPNREFKQFWSNFPSIFFLSTYLAL